MERAKVFVALTPPADERAYRSMQSVSVGSMTLSFETSQDGMQAHSMARWVNTREEKGPCSQISTATVAA